MTRTLQTLMLATLLALTGAAPAHAHQLNVFASVAGETITVEGKFSSGRPAMAGAVKVYDSANALLHETQLSADGTATLPVPASVTGIKIEVIAADGHSNYWIMTAEDLAAGAAK